MLTDVLALDDAVGDGAAETFACFLLVAVVAGPVEETVSGLECLVDGLCGEG